MTPAWWADLSHFQPSEFVAPERMSQDLLERLDRAREVAGVPFRITSSFRTLDPGAHGDGDAVDIAAPTSAARMAIVRGLLAAGFRRIGVYDRHIHADVSARLPQDVLWPGKSS